MERILVTRKHHNMKPRRLKNVFLKKLSNEIMTIFFSVDISYGKENIYKRIFKNKQFCTKSAPNLYPS